MKGWGGYSRIKKCGSFYFNIRNPWQTGNEHEPLLLTDGVKHYPKIAWDPKTLPEIGSSQAQWVWTYCLPWRRSIAILEQFTPQCCQRLHPQFIHGVQRAKIFCMWNAHNAGMWIYINGSMKNAFQRWSAWFESSEKCPKSTRRIWPNSSARIWPNLAYTNDI